jgi:hypothetical protein
LTTSAIDPNQGHDPIRNLLLAAEALEDLSGRPAAAPGQEAARAAASQRLDRAIDHLRELGAPEEEILALARKR